MLQEGLWRKISTSWIGVSPCQYSSPFSFHYRHFKMDPKLRMLGMAKANKGPRSKTAGIQKKQEPISANHDPDGQRNKSSLFLMPKIPNGLSKCHSQRIHVQQTRIHASGYEPFVFGNRVHHDPRGRSPVDPVRFLDYPSRP